MLTFNHVRDFYVLLSIRELVKEHPFRKAWEKLDEDTAEVLDRLTYNLSYAMRDYLTLASFGEARHGLYRTNLSIYPDLHVFSMDNSGSPLLSREITMTEALYYDPRDALPKLVEIFNGGGWSSGVGGPRWGEIAAGALTWWTVFKGMPIAFIDHCVDLRHNNGTAFSKIEAGNLMETASMHYWRMNKGESLFNWLEVRKNLSPLNMVTHTEVVMPKTHALAQRCCTLSNMSRTTNITVTRDNLDIDYNPLEWGDRKLGTFTRSTRLSQDAITRSVLFSASVDWKVLDKIKHVLPKDFANADIDRALMGYEKKVKEAVVREMRPFYEIYPKHEHFIAAETERIIKEKLTAKRQKIIDGVMKKFNLSYADMDAAMDEFMDKEFDNLDAYDSGIALLRQRIYGMAEDMTASAPTLIRRNVSDRTNSHAHMLFKRSAATNWLLINFGTRSRTEVSGMMDIVTRYYNRAREEITYKNTKKLRTPDVVGDAIRAHERSLVLFAKSMLYSTTVANAAAGMFRARVKAYIDEKEKSTRKEVMQGKAAFKKAKLAEDWEPKIPEPVEPPAPATRKFKSKLLSQAYAAKVAMNEYVKPDNGMLEYGKFKSDSTDKDGQFTPPYPPTKPNKE